VKTGWKYYFNPVFKTFTSPLICQASIIAAKRKEGGDYAVDPFN